MIALFPLAHAYISVAFRVRNSVPLRCLNEEFDFTFIARIFLSAGPAEWPAEYESAEYESTVPVSYLPAPAALTVSVLHCAAIPINNNKAGRSVSRRL
jgi:hypothetical protein